MTDFPNKNNFCGGSYQDWLEVYLVPVCNGKCSWCIDKNNYKPNIVVSSHALTQKIVSSGKKNIILLGGEPTLYTDLPNLIRSIFYHSSKNINLYLTTNGSFLSPEFVISSGLINLTGINISVHHYDMNINEQITGIMLNLNILKESVDTLKKYGVKVRLNCNCIKNYIDNLEDIHKYIEFGKQLKVDAIRFAELKGEEENFIDLTKIFGSKYGINNDPFLNGCSCGPVIINDMSVSFRQMCGLQTSCRARPTFPPECEPKKVLYYDGVLYNGWQSAENEDCGYCCY